MNPEGSGSARAVVLAELRGLRGRIHEVQGSIVATTDGMVLSHDLGATEAFGIEPEGVAALSAVNLGLSQRIADTASHGELTETVIRGAFGQVITCAAGDRALITVLTRTPDDVAGLRDEIHQLAGRVGVLLLAVWQDDAAHWHANAPLPGV